MKSYRMEVSPYISRAAALEFDKAKHMSPTSLSNSLCIDTL